ncbi:MAG: redoxin domain-containing protein [Candidatus Omnitrophica bacterium]|nr:redoxin domain-containing protein [Candidatus Omnitrophota bacterium]
MKRFLIVTFFAVAIVMVGILFFKGADAQNLQADRGTEAADFTLRTSGGEEVTLSDLRGKVVILDFWATWCPYCVKGIPSLQRMYAAYQEKGLVVLGINIRESIPKVTSFVNAHAITYPMLLDSDGAVAEAYNVRGIPNYLILDGDGVIQYRGFALPDNTEEIISTLLEGAAAS